MQILSQKKGTYFSFVFSLYVAFGNSIFLDYIAPGNIWQTNEFSQKLLWLVGIAMVLEVVGLKYFFNKAESDQQTPEKSAKTSNLLKFFFFVVRISLSGMVALSALHLSGLVTESNTYIFLIVMTTVLVREFFITLMLPAEKTNLPQKKITTSIPELLMLPYACVAYSAFWGSIIPKINEFGLENNTGLAIMQAIGLTVAFAIFVFLPLQFVFLMNKEQNETSRLKRLAIWFAPLAIFFVRLFVS